MTVTMGAAWAYCILVVYQFRAVFSECPPPTGSDPALHPVIDFITVHPDHYDKNYTSIQADGRRPFGFMKGTVYYNQNMPDPCVRIRGASGKRIEIMAETEPITKLCLRDQTMNTPACFPHQYSKCQQSPGDDVYIEFLCDSGCSENDVTFWYRLTVSLPPSEKDPEMWCDERDVDEYPSSLLPFDPADPAYSIRTTTPKTGTASRTGSPSVLLSSTITLLVMITTSILSIH